MRYAIYYTPPAGDALSRAASGWLGRDPFGEAAPETPAWDGLSSGIACALTADPRRYGFHATLKAPFRLADGMGEADLVAQLHRFCAENRPFDIPCLTLGRIGRFFALVPDAVYGDLQSFAANVVKVFDPFRAALNEAELARRKPHLLSPAQQALLARWGYPYVMEEFRFHMTLTGPVPDEAMEAVDAGLRRIFAPFIGKPLTIGGLALFQEKAPGADFTIQTWLPLSGHAAGGS
ncbi:DUF1045 domain-containing protein [Allorhizobium undicola]|uniref:DUF1045 domain-containing protein n=1 Tax=Allorhizobium undicola TaxID=78527 RepID=UPI0004815B84|nr:DUF1045 domain-containing protein [Allorhizobium undicola]